MWRRKESSLSQGGRGVGPGVGARGQGRVALATLCVYFLVTSLSLSELFGRIPSTLFGRFALLWGWGSRACEEPTDGGRMDSE
ncbi:hypothetical protein SBA6_1220002 [Candidatus Sulfopaludibacter sp. SbA6]|nr:hypothetical protein SBA6_1220002 [Candidatus Sulfopaludibacter sp. SbA6]